MPGPFTEEVNRCRQAANFTGPSSSSVAKLSDFRRQLFMVTITRQDQKKMANTDSSPGTSTNQQKNTDEELPLQAEEDLQEQEQQEATPRRNNPPCGQPSRRPEGPEVENILTQLT